MPTPPTMASTTNAILMTETSTPRYLAMPAATPPSIRSCLLRTRAFGLGPALAGDWSARSVPGSELMVVFMTPSLPVIVPAAYRDQP